MPLGYRYEHKINSYQKSVAQQRHAFPSYQRNYSPSVV